MNDSTNQLKSDNITTAKKTNKKQKRQAHAKWDYYRNTTHMSCRHSGDHYTGPSIIVKDILQYEEIDSLQQAVIVKRQLVATANVDIIINDHEQNYEPLFF